MPSKRKVELAVLALCLNKLNVKKKKKKKRRAEWEKKWLLDRDKHTHINLLSVKNISIQISIIICEWMTRPTILCLKW